MVARSQCTNRLSLGPYDDDRIRRHAAELVALAPDAILAMGSSTVRALQQESATVPIVFANTADPVGGGLIASLARPGGNATGFTSIEYGMSSKMVGTAQARLRLGCGGGDHPRSDGARGSGQLARSKARRPLSVLR